MHGLRLRLNPVDDPPAVAATRHHRGGARRAHRLARSYLDALLNQSKLARHFNPL